jgi:CBS domain-containing protein
MKPTPIAVPLDASVTEFIEDFVYRYHHRVFPVTSDGHLFGCVGTEEAAAVDRAAWTTTAVGQVMKPCTAAEVARPDTDAVQAFAQMRRNGRGRLWVVEEGRLVGVLSLHDMMEFLSVKLELDRGRSVHGDGNAARNIWKKSAYE